MVSVQPGKGGMRNGGWDDVEILPGAPVVFIGGFNDASEDLVMMLKM